MAASAERIDFVDYSIVSFEQRRLGPSPFNSHSILVVNFGIFRRGPTHVAGLLYTTKFWAERKTVFASFKGFQGELELWRASVREEGPSAYESASFGYIIFCDDHRDINAVRKIYNTNNGETFRIQ